MGDTEATSHGSLERMHPEMQTLLDARAGLPVAETLADERANWTAYSERLSRPPPGDMMVEDRIVRRDGLEVAVRVYRSAGATSPAPGLVYLHGGGFMKGDLESSDSIAWGFAAATGAVVVSVDYRLSPEHPYPAAFDDTYAVLTEMTEHPESLGLDATRIGIAGDSAGGNLAAATCIAARDRGGPSLLAQALVYPGTGLDQDAGSYVENAETPGLTRTATLRYRTLYLPGNEDTLDPYARPVVAEDLGGLPPAWVHSAEIDPIRDDGRHYAARLALAGNEVHYREARGMIHGFMRARFASPAARHEYELVCGFLTDKLGRSE